jgi:hypothetical protein
MTYAPYQYRRPAAPRRGGIVPNPSRRNTAGLGLLPLAAAAASPTVENIVKNAATAIIGIFDPGKKRDANREARAEMYYQLALAGSITATRRLYGGQTIQYTDKEKQMYRDRWAKFAQANPTLAAKAQQMGGLGIPEPGSDVQPPALSATDQEKIRQEIALATGNPSEPLPPSVNLTPSGTPPTNPAAPNLNVPPMAHPPIDVAGFSASPTVLAIAALGIALAFTKKKR